MLPPEVFLRIMLHCETVLDAWNLRNCCRNAHLAHQMFVCDVVRGETPFRVLATTHKTQYHPKFTNKKTSLDIARLDRTHLGQLYFGVHFSHVHTTLNYTEKIWRRDFHFSCVFFNGVYERLCHRETGLYVSSDGPRMTTLTTELCFYENPMCKDYYGVFDTGAYDGDEYDHECHKAYDVVAHEYYE